MATEQLTDEQKFAMISAHATASASNVEKWQQEHVATLRDDDGSVFYPVSLGNWMAACERGRVDCVSAFKVADVATEALWRFDQPGEFVNAELSAMHRAIKQHRQPKCMFRWDCCAPAAVKWRLSEGRAEWSDEFGEPPSPDDPRAYDIIYDYMYRRMTVWQRPWTQARIIDGYPVEYRVYVWNGEVVGVSNYYPQRPLPETRLIRSEARLAEALTEVLMACIEAPMLLPEFVECDLSKLSGTADFMATERGLLFLEGGPPHTAGWGAHPCCFRPGEIGGLALADRNIESPVS